MSNPVNRQSQSGYLRLPTDISRSEITHHCDHDDDSVGTEPRQGLAGNLSDSRDQEQNIDQDHHAGDGVETDLDVAVSHPTNVLR